MDALEPFASAGMPNSAKALPYLDEGDRKSHYAIHLSIDLTTSSGKMTRLAEASAENLLYSFPQMLAHHSVGGCPFNVGDLMGSGTISGESKAEKGCLLERTENGKIDIELDCGEKRRFLEDGDTIRLMGVCGGEAGALVGFGECSGTILPAIGLDLM